MPQVAPDESMCAAARKPWTATNRLARSRMWFSSRWSARRLNAKALAARLKRFAKMRWSRCCAPRTRSRRRPPLPRGWCLACAAKPFRTCCRHCNRHRRRLAESVRLRFALREQRATWSGRRSCATWFSTRTAPLLPMPRRCSRSATRMRSTRSAIICWLSTMPQSPPWAASSRWSALIVCCVRTSPKSTAASTPGTSSIFPAWWSGNQVWSFSSSAAPACCPPIAPSEPSSCCGMACGATCAGIISMWWSGVRASRAPIPTVSRCRCRFCTISHRPPKTGAPVRTRRAGWRWTGLRRTISTPRPRCACCRRWSKAICGSAHLSATVRWSIINSAPPMFWSWCRSRRSPDATSTISARMRRVTRRKLYSRRSDTVSMMWSLPFFRISVARGRVGRMFSSRLTRLMPVQSDSAFSVASSSDSFA